MTRVTHVITHGLAILAAGNVVGLTIAYTAIWLTGQHFPLVEAIMWLTGGMVFSEAVRTLWKRFTRHITGQDV